MAASAHQSRWGVSCRRVHVACIVSLCGNACPRAFSHKFTEVLVFRQMRDPLSPGPQRDRGDRGQQKIKFSLSCAHPGCRYGAAGARRCDGNCAPRWILARVGARRDGSDARGPFGLFTGRPTPQGPRTCPREIGRRVRAAGRATWARLTALSPAKWRDLPCKIGHFARPDFRILAPKI